MNNLSVNNYNRKNNQFSFKSKNCPINPFIIQTKKGHLFIEEMKREDLNKTSSFLFDSMKGLITKRDYLKKPYGKQKMEYKSYLKYLLIHCLEKADGNSTILIAKDSHGKVKALTNLQHFDEIDVLMQNGFKDLNTGYIQDCYVAPKFRNQGIGKIMMDKILKTAEGHFFDIFVCSENPAVDFYKGKGFSSLDASNPIVQKVLSYILEIRGDKNYVTPMLKTLNFKNNWEQRMLVLMKN